MLTSINGRRWAFPPRSLQTALWAVRGGRRVRHSPKGSTCRNSKRRPSPGRSVRSQPDAKPPDPWARALLTHAEVGPSDKKTGAGAFAFSAPRPRLPSAGAGRLRSSAHAKRRAAQYARRPILLLRQTCRWPRGAACSSVAHGRFCFLTDQYERESLSAREGRNLLAVPGGQTPHEGDEGAWRFFCGVPFPLVPRPGPDHRGGQVEWPSASAGGGIINEVRKKMKGPPPTPTQRSFPRVHFRFSPGLWRTPVSASRARILLCSHCSCVFPARRLCRCARLPVSREHHPLGWGNCSVDRVMC